MMESALSIDEIEDLSLRLAETIDHEFSRRCIQIYIKQQLKRVVPETYIPHLSLVMVDDGAMEIGNYLPHLVALTRGRVEPVLYMGQGAETLSHTVSQTTAQVALMDYTMKPEQGLPLYGTDVVERLRSVGVNKTFIGFSGNDVSERFLACGASGFVSKSIEPARTIPELHRTLVSIRNQEA